MVQNRRALSKRSEELSSRNPRFRRHPPPRQRRGQLAPRMASLQWVSLPLPPSSPQRHASAAEQRRGGRPRTRPAVQPTTVELTPTRAHCTLAREMTPGGSERSPVHYMQQRTPAAETRSARKRRLDKNEKAAQYAAKKAASSGRRAFIARSALPKCICDGCGGVYQVLANHKLYKHRCAPNGVSGHRMRYAPSDYRSGEAADALLYSEYCAQLGL